MSFPVRALDGYPIVRSTTSDDRADLVVCTGPRGINALVADLIDRCPGAAISRNGPHRYAIHHPAFEGSLVGEPHDEFAALSVRAPRAKILGEVEEAPDTIALLVKQETGSTVLALATGGLMALALDPLRRLLIAETSAGAPRKSPRGA